MRKIKKTLAVVSAAVLTLTTGSTVVMAEKEGYTTFELSLIHICFVVLHVQEFHIWRINR